MLPELTRRWVELQQAQWSALLQAPQLLVAWQREWWDLWICRWGGGVPLDG